MFASVFVRCKLTSAISCHPGVFARFDDVERTDTAMDDDAVLNGAAITDMADADDAADDGYWV